MVDFSGVPVKQRWAWAWTTRHGVECTGQEAVQHGTGCISIRVTAGRTGEEPGAGRGQHTPGERTRDKLKLLKK